MFTLTDKQISLLSWVAFGLALIGLTIFVSSVLLDTTAWQLETQRSLSGSIGKPQSVSHTAGISNWKTYRNDEYGFALSYPTNWKLIEYSPESVIMDPPNSPGIATYFGVSIDNITLGTIREAMPKEIVREEIVIAGRASDKYIYDPSRALVYIPFGDRVGVYRIDLYTPPGVDEPNQILSTIRFTEPIDTSTGSAPLTTGWKTYRNEQYGFEMKYPPLGAGWQVRENNAVIYFDYRLTNSSPLVNNFGIAVYENKAKSDFFDWFKHNVDSRGVLGNYNNFFNHQSVVSGEVYEMGTPLPDEFVNAYGPIPTLYFVTSDRKYVLAVNLSQVSELDLYGYDSNGKIHALLKQILSTFRLI